MAPALVTNSPLLPPTSDGADPPEVRGPGGAPERAGPRRRLRVLRRPGSRPACQGILGSLPLSRPEEGGPDNGVKDGDARKGSDKDSFPHPNPLARGRQPDPGPRSSAVPQPVSGPSYPLPKSYPLSLMSTDSPMVAPPRRQHLLGRQDHAPWEFRGRSVQLTHGRITEETRLLHRPGKIERGSRPDRLLGSPGVKDRLYRGRRWTV